MTQEDTGGDVLEEANGKEHEPTEGAHRSAHVDPVGRVEQKIAPQESEDSLEADADADGDRQHVERRIPFVRQDLVDDELEEERNDEAEHQKHDGSQADTAEEPFLSQQFGNEPGQPEGLLGVGNAILPRGEDDLARPFLVELFGAQRDHFRIARPRVENADLERVTGSAHADDDNRAAVLQSRQNRKGLAERNKSRRSKPRGLGPHSGRTDDMDELPGRRIIRAERIVVDEPING